MVSRDPLLWPHQQAAGSPVDENNNEIAQARQAVWHARHRPLFLDPSAPEKGLVSFHHGLQRLFSEPACEPRRAWAAALTQAAPHVTSPTRVLWSLWGEQSEQQADASPSAPARWVDALDTLGQRAEPVLAASAELLRAHTRPDVAWVDVLARGAALQRNIAWPKTLSPTTFTTWLPANAGWFHLPRFTLGPLPSICNGTSFFRGLVQFGARWADATLRLQRSPLRPNPWQRYEIGGLFGALLLHPPFLVQALGMSQNEAQQTRQAMACSVLVAWRLAAARLQIRHPALRGENESLFEKAHEVFSEALTREVPAALTLACPQLHESDPWRFAAFGESARRFNQMVGQYDEDWFRNPHASAGLCEQLLISDPSLVPPERWAENEKYCYQVLIDCLS